MITEECISCAACKSECPQGAINQGPDIFEIVPELCCECVGFFDELACASVCPVDCCLVDPESNEDKATLLQKAKKVHPDKVFSADFPCHDS